MEKAGLKLVGTGQRKESAGVGQFAVWLCVRTCIIMAVMIAFQEQFLSVMTLSVDRPRLYLILYAAIGVSVLVCMSSRRRWLVPAVMAGYGIFLWRQREIIRSALQVVNEQLLHLKNYEYASAILTARRAVMTPRLQQGLLFVLIAAAFLFTVILVWQRGRIAAGAGMLFPMIVIAVVGSFPSKQSFWGMLITGGVYFAVLRCKDGIDSFKTALITGSVLLAVCMVSGSVGDHIFARRMEPGSAYLQARQSLQSVVDKIGGNRYARYLPGATNYLKEIERFEPETGTARTVVLETQPTEPIYYREETSGKYTGEEWEEISRDALGTEEVFREYPQGLEELQAFCTDAVGTSESYVTDFIDAALSGNTEYTYEPGATPEDRDFAEYFLFENQKGFCVHYATTATLMYRICGIASRYVTGYRIPAENFHQQEDGTWAAEALGTMGHAWSEVYTEDEWKVREHTPGYIGDTPEQDAPEDQSEDTQTETQPETEQQEQVQPEMPTQEQLTPDSAKGFGTGNYVQIVKVILSIAIILLLTGFIICLQCRLRYIRKRQEFRRRRENAGIQSIYRNLYEQAVFMGMEKSEPLDWQTVQNMSRYSETITAEEWEWIYDTVRKALFSNEELPVEDIRKMEQMNRRYKKEVYAKLSRLRRMIYRWIKCL